MRNCVYISIYVQTLQNCSFHLWWHSLFIIHVLGTVFRRVCIKTFKPFQPHTSCPDAPSFLVGFKSCWFPQRFRIPVRRCIQRRIQFLGLKKTGRRGRLGALIHHHCRNAETKEPSTGKRGLSENRVRHSIYWFINVNHHCPNVKIAIWGYTWWITPLSKWVITPVFLSGLTLLIPFITGVITHLRFVGWATKYSICRQLGYEVKWYYKNGVPLSLVLDAAWCSLTHAGYDHPLPRCSQSRTNVVWK